MYESCLKNQKNLKKEFDGCTTKEEKYQKIIELGKRMAPFDEKYKTEENIVPGCQSTVYLKSFFKDGRVFFEGFSDAMISAGIIYLLIKTYSSETPETILTCTPKFLEELGIANILTPMRANGMASMYLKIKQEALKYLTI